MIFLKSHNYLLISVLNNLNDSDAETLNETGLYFHGIWCII